MPCRATTGESALYTTRPRWLDIKWVFIVLQYPDIWIQMDMWQFMYGIGYALIANAKFCKQLLYKL